MPGKTPTIRSTASTATYRAGELLLAAGKTVEAWTALWKVVTDWPDEPVAADALRALLDDGRRRDARALADEIGKLLTPLAETQVADNLVWSLADLDEHELANPAAARAFYDRIPADYPEERPARRRALARRANLSRAARRSEGRGRRGCARCSRRARSRSAPAATSRSGSTTRSSMLGKILRDDLHDLPGAAAAFRQLPKDYPASILRDDALYELARDARAAGDHAGACAAMADAAKKLEPDSKYLAQGELGCRVTGAAIRLRDVHKRYGRRDVLAGVSLDVPRGGAARPDRPGGVGQERDLQARVRARAARPRRDRGARRERRRQARGRSSASCASGSACCSRTTRCSTS